jgi:hypothetical protein
MSKFHFNTKQNDGTWLGHAPLECPTHTAAITQAKKVLAEMAMDGFPDDNGCQLSVEVENGEHEPLGP